MRSMRLVKESLNRQSFYIVIHQQKTSSCIENISLRTLLIFVQLFQKYHKIGSQP